MRITVGIFGGVLLTLCSFYTVTHSDAFNNYGQQHHNAPFYQGRLSI